MLKFHKVPEHLRLSEKNNIIEINYQKLFQDAAIAWQENDYKPIQISNRFLNIINKHRKNR